MFADEKPWPTLDEVCAQLAQDAQPRERPVAVIIYTASAFNEFIRALGKTPARPAVVTFDEGAASAAAAA